MADEPKQPDDQAPAQADDTQTEPTDTPEEPKRDETPDAPSQESDEPKGEATEPSEDEPAEKAEATPEEEPKPTRKERREERKQRYEDSIRRTDATPVAPTPVKDYQPKPFSEMVTDDGMLDTQAAEADRQAAAQSAAQKAASTAQYQAQQDEFRKSVEHDKQMLEANPKYAWMKQDSPDYDADLVQEVNDKFLALAGYKETPVIDPVTGQATGSRWEVGRPDTGYKQFIEAEQALWDRVSEERSERTAQNVAASKATQGARPGATTKGPDITDPSVIAKMSPEELRKNEKRMLDFASTLPPR